MLYDLWADYLRTSVETLVAQAFEVHEFMDSSSLWFQGTLLNMGGVRRFYHHQSRLLQNGFSTLFGAKLQELYLKLSFTNASSTTSTTTQLPDILGIIARAKVSKDAMTTSREVSEIGRFTSDSGGARFHEKGILNYARKSVQLDMELLEGIREEACTGMDAFDTLQDMEPTSRASALSLFLLQLLERMAMRLESFYGKLAEISIYNPEIEQNPARTRWNRLRRRIHDRSFFVLAQDLTVSHRTGSGSIRPPRPSDVVEFDHVISRIQQNINSKASQSHSQRSGSRPPTSLTERHFARTTIQPQNQQPSTAYETHQDEAALRKMISFIDINKRAIRRLSKLPATDMSMEQLIATYGQQNVQNQLQQQPPTSYSLFPKQTPHQRRGTLPTPTSTPPLSRSSSRSTPSRAPSMTTMIPNRTRASTTTSIPHLNTNLSYRSHSQNSGLYHRQNPLTPASSRDGSPSGSSSSGGLEAQLLGMGLNKRNTGMSGGGGSGSAGQRVVRERVGGLGRRESLSGPLRTLVLQQHQQQRGIGGGGGMATF